jgi:acyl-homoserine lactone acylase PvdQ
VGGHLRKLGHASVPIVALGLVLATLAGAQVPTPEYEREDVNDYGGFYSVLAVGQGKSASALDLLGNQTVGAIPAEFQNQRGLYVDLGPLAQNVNAENFGRFFKPGRFGTPAGDIASYELPRPGVSIVRDRLNVPHVYGKTRADTMWGAGYATAVDRLFMIDVLRHTARGTLSELIGAGNNASTVKMDAAQLKIADYTEAELHKMIDDTVARAGAEGPLIKKDLDNYVAGINAFIAAAGQRPDKMPAEYAALGRTPTPWLETDTVAVASLIGGIFGKGGGSESIAAEALRAAQARFGGAAGRRIFDDFRGLEDPEAPVTTTRRFPFPGTGHVKSRAVALPDAGSVRDYDPLAAAGTSTAAASAGAHVPAWVRTLQTRGLSLAGPSSNATLVTAAHSKSRRPLMVAGPQVAYYSPEILMELDLHGPGIDARGVAFPGISLYVLLGRGRDFSWTATTATTDNVDEFVEKLCEPDGSAPTRNSTHYLYKGTCRPFKVQTRSLSTGPSLTAPTAPRRTYKLRLLRSVHGPVTRTATVGGAPVAIASARSTYFHEIDSTLAFYRLNSNLVHNARQFQRAFGTVNFLFNWFYIDDRDIAFIQSGWFPLRARGTDPSLPTWGTGAYDWRGFNPDTFDSRRASYASLPKQINPPRGYFANWNNKQAPGWHAADDVFGAYGSVHRSERLEDRVRAAIARGRIDLPRLVSVMGDAGTADLRGQEVYPLLRRVIGVPRNPALANAVRLLDQWVRRGSHRVDRDGDNSYDESAAVALMDAWWEPLLRGIYEPVVGKPFVEAVRRLNGFHDAPGPGGSAFFNGWYGYVEKDLRTLLGDRVRGRYSRRYCGRGSLSRCRATLLRTLGTAIAAAERRYGRPLAQLKVPATCASATPQRCDQIEFTTAGAIATPPIPWQDRGTYQQAVEVQGHGPRS